MESSQPVIVKGKKSKRMEIIKLGIISSGISTVTARPVYRSLMTFLSLLNAHSTKAEAGCRFNCMRMWIRRKVATG